MRPETESLEGLGDSLAKAMRCNARVAFCFLLSDRKNRDLGERPLLAQSGRSRNERLWNGRLWRKADVGETRTFGSPSALMGYARQVVVAVERRVSAATGCMTVKKIIVSSVC